MRGLVTEDQEVLVLPQNIKSANKGHVTTINAGDFIMELEQTPKGFLENTYCEFYTQTPKGKVYFDSYIKKIDGNNLTIASPAKHKFLQRRQYSRVKFNTNLTLNKNKEKHDIFTLDLSAGGLKFKTNKTLDIDGIYEINIPLNTYKSIQCHFQPIRIERVNNEYIISGQFFYDKGVDKMLIVQFCAKRAFEIRNK